MLPPYLPPADTHQQAGEWQAQSAAASLPYGWTDEALAVVVGMAAQFGTTPHDLMALFWSESSAQPRINSAGLAQITTPAQTDMGWPAGAWAQIVAGPLPAQLAGIAAWWRHLEARYLRGQTFAQKAAIWRVPVSAAIYAFHAFPSSAMNAAHAGTPLVSAPSNAYANNAGLDAQHKKYITIQDLADRIAMKGREMSADPFGRALLGRLELIAQSDPPSLAKIWASYAEYYQRATGQAIPTPSANNAPSRSRLWLAVAALALGAAVWTTQQARR